MRAKIVYLDQWVWINLSRVHYGKSEEWRVAYDSVMASARDRSAIFPLSLSHLNETAQRHDDASRGRLVDFMADLWNANAIRPWSQMLKPELRNVVRVRLGKQPIDLTPYAIGRGITHVLGAKIEIQPRVAAPDPRQRSMMEEALASPDRWRDLKSSEHARAFREGSPVDAKFTADLQKAIDHELASYEPGKKRDSAVARFLTDVVADPLIDAIANEGADPNAFLTAHFSGRPALESMFLELPTLYTFHALNYERNTTRRIKTNDVWDLALNNAIPYCDVVATETAWCNLAAKTRLDVLYATTMVHDPQALARALT